MRANDRYINRPALPVFALFVALVIAWPARAADAIDPCKPELTPVECYVTATHFHSWMCEMAAMGDRVKSRLAAMTGGQPELVGIVKCVDDAEAAIKWQYSRALESLKSKPAVQKMLKDHYAAWVTNMDRLVSVDTPAGMEESARLNEMGRRLELEQ